MAQSPPAPSSSDSGGFRQGIAIVLVVLFGFLLIGANQAGWLIRTVLNTDSFVSTFEPLPSNPEVAQALGATVGETVIESFGVQQQVADALPPDLGFIAVPIASSLGNVIADSSAAIIQTDQFTAIWTAALTVSHKAVEAYVGISRGGDGALTTSNGEVILDLTGMATSVSDKLVEKGYNGLDITGERLEIPLFQLPDSGMIQTIVKLITSIRWALLITTFVLLIGAVAVAKDRRKITVWIGSATIIAMALSLVEVRYLREAAVGSAADPIQKAGLDAGLGVVLSPFFAQTWLILVLGLVIALAAWVAGPSHRAQAIRISFTAKGRAAVGADGDPSQFASSVAEHRRMIEGIVLLVGVGILLFGPQLSLWAALFLVAIVAVVIIVVEFMEAAAGPNVVPAVATTETTDNDATEMTDGRVDETTA